MLILLMKGNSMIPISRRLPVVAALVLSLAACANQPPISGNPIQDAFATVKGPAVAGAPAAPDLITQGIADAQSNFAQAVTLGVLSATDPAPGCLNSAATVLGVGSAAAPSFTPKVSDLISAGSVAYIRLQQLKTLTGGAGLKVSSACTQLVGQIVLDAGSLLNKTAISAFLPGAGTLLP